MSEIIFNIQVKASRRLGYLVMLMHLLAFSAVWLADLPLLVQLLLMGLLLLSSHYYRVGIWRAPNNIEQLRYSTLDGWQLAVGNQQLLPITLQQCFISRPLLIINFRQAGKRRSQLLLADSAEHDALRRLRVLLRQTA